MRQDFEKSTQTISKMTSKILKSEILMLQDRIPKITTFLRCCKVQLVDIIPKLEKMSLPKEEEKTLARYKQTLQDMINSWMLCFQRLISQTEWIEPELKSKQLWAIIQPFGDKLEFATLVQELISLQNLERSMYCIDEILIE